MKGSTEACSSAEVEIMKKLREAYENDVVAVNVSSPPSCLGCPCWGGQEKTGGSQSVMARAAPHPSCPHYVGRTPRNPLCLLTGFSVSLLSQQQANLIPGLNLSALGIFSTGLPMLPSSAGARGAAAATPYHPFAVSARGFRSAGDVFLGAESSLDSRAVALGLG